MLVQALARYADTYLADQLADKAFEEKRVRYLVEIDEQGHFLRVSDHVQMEQRGKKQVEVARPLLAPKSPVSRTGGLHALLACDALDYALGPAPGVWTEPAEQAKQAEHFAAFAERIREAVEATADPALQACAQFYADPNQVDAACDALVSRDKPPKGGELVALAVRPTDPNVQDPGGPVVLRPAVREFWTKHFDKHSAQHHAKGGTAMCLISGKVGPIAVTHDKIKASGLGGQPSGVSLMSFDKASFRSYGWKQNANSPVGTDRAAAYVIATNDLLRQGPHRRGRSRDSVLRTRTDDYGGMGLLYWTREPEDEDIVTAFMEGADPEHLRVLLAAPFYGSDRVSAAVKDTDFYLLAVSCNGGRLVVRDWLWDSLKNVRDNVAEWFEGLRAPDVFAKGELCDPPQLWQLLDALAPPRVKANDKLNAQRTLSLVRRALLGQPLGFSILAAALKRLRVEEQKRRLQPQRIGLIRLCVNDNLKEGETPMTERLDEGQGHPAYLCGRLLAMYEGLQYQAQGELNVSVGDRYYGLASTYPQLAFPKLETLSKAHLKKLRRDNRAAAVAIERRLHELVAQFDSLGGVFPGSLSLQDQGRFAIGYHHQKAADAAAAKEAKNRNQQEQTAQANTDS